MLQKNDQKAKWIIGVFSAVVFIAVTFLSKRIVMALAPSNQNILYVAYENGESQSGSTGKNEADLFRLDVSSGSNVWTNLSANVPDYTGQLDGVDPFHVQEGYNLMFDILEYFFLSMGILWSKILLSQGRCMSPGVFVVSLF